MIRDFIIWIWNCWQDILGTQYKLCECGCGLYVMASALDFLLWIVNFALVVITIAAIIYVIYLVINY